MPILGTPSLPLPRRSIFGLPRSELAHRDFIRVKLQGRFDNAQERYLFAVLEGQAGWQVIAPFITTDRRLVLVNRGFVPDRLKDSRSRPQSLIEGETELAGLLRRKPKAGMFTPANQPSRNIWYWADVDALLASVPDAAAPEAGERPRSGSSFWRGSDLAKTRPARPFGHSQQPSAICLHLVCARRGLVGDDLLAASLRQAEGWKRLMPLPIPKLMLRVPGRSVGEHCVRYISTRGKAPPLGFEEVMLSGLAPDGGLYMPEEWPRLPDATLYALRGAPYGEVAFRVMAPFIGDAVPEAELRRMIDGAYGSFAHAAVTPLVQLAPNHWLLELFHGPTLAFKDVAMQLLVRLLDGSLERRSDRATLVCATSGDTGGAAVEAFKNSAHCTLFVLHPHGRVSEVQRRQMTTVNAPSVHNVAIEGNFDDCQAIVKALFADRAFRDRSEAVGGQFDQLGTPPGPGRLLRLCRLEPWRPSARGELLRAHGKFRQCLCGLRRMEARPARRASHRRDQRQ